MERTEHFDVVVVGAGLTECILAGALAKAGKTVLHIDSAAVYGAQYAALRASEFIDQVVSMPHHDAHASSILAAKSTPERHSADDAHDDNEQHQEQQHQQPQQPIHRQRLAALLATDQIARHVASICGVRLAHVQDDAWASSHPVDMANAFFVASLVEKSRHFNMDLAPVLLYSRGPLVDLLVSSRVGPYLEFKLLEDMFFEWNGELEKVPSGKEDVFTSKTTDLLGKRRLMKFLTFALEYESQMEIWSEFRDQPYADFLASQKLGAKMSAVIQHAIALVGSAQAAQTMTTAQGLALTHQHLNSLGRFGRRAFLMGIYGTGSELCQAFSRYCAVFGGVYILGFQFDKIELLADDIVVSGEGQQFHAKWIVVGEQHADKLPIKVTAAERHESWRSTVITDYPLVGSDTLSVAVLPPQDGVRSDGIFAVQHTSATSTCPDGYYVTSVVSDAPGTTKEHLQSAIASLQRHSAASGTADRDASSLQLFYQMETASVPTGANWIADNVAVCSGPSGGLTAEHHAHEARRLFEKICPDGEFYPQEAAPSQDDD
ncbi:GDP dissociation inhibitor [Entophlyctis helioformis]|nr:GDP dissociation inhibitor [Entophlyctis helioformis]